MKMAGSAGILRRIVASAMLVLLAGCAGAPEASRSLTFDTNSDKAIVIIGTSVNRAQEEEIKAGRSLSSFWMEYNPDTQRLVPGGKTFLTRVEGGVFSEPGYLQPTVSVLEVDPGDYALIGAGFPHLMTTFVHSKDPPGQKDSLGRPQSWTYTVDPRLHVDPWADVDRRRNFAFSIYAGQVVYIGHFEFQKPTYFDGLLSTNYFLDSGAAREALRRFPGINADLLTLDLTQPPQSVAR